MLLSTNSLLLLILIIASHLVPVAQAGSFQGYLVDNTGSIVSTPYGECVKSGSWNSSSARPDCDHKLRSKAKASFELKEFLKELDPEKIDPRVDEVVRKAINSLERFSQTGEVDEVLVEDYGKPSLSNRGKSVEQEQQQPSGCEYLSLGDKDDGVHQYEVAIRLIVGLCQPAGDLSTDVRQLLVESIGYGHIDAMNVLGYLLVDGELFGYSSPYKAIYYFKKANQQGGSDAKYNLGFLNRHGIAVKKNVGYGEKLMVESGANGSLFRLRQHGSDISMSNDCPDESEGKRRQGPTSNLNEKVTEEMAGQTQEPESHNNIKKYKFPYLRN